MGGSGKEGDEPVTGAVYADEHWYGLTSWVKAGSIILELAGADRRARNPHLEGAEGGCWTARDRLRHSGPTRRTCDCCDRAGFDVGRGPRHVGGLGTAGAPVPITGRKVGRRGYRAPLCAGNPGGPSSCAARARTRWRAVGRSLLPLLASLVAMKYRGTTRPHSRGSALRARPCKR